MSDDTRTFTIFIIARLFSSYILLGHFQWSGFERKLGDFQTFSGMLANVWFSSETFPERCGSGGHGEIEKLIRAVLFPLSPRVGWSKEKKNILLQDIFQIFKNIFSPYQNIAMLWRAILRVIKCFSKRRNIATSLVVPKNIATSSEIFFERSLYPRPKKVEVFSRQTSHTASP